MPPKGSCRDFYARMPQADPSAPPAPGKSAARPKRPVHPISKIDQRLRRLKQHLDVVRLEWHHQIPLSVVPDRPKVSFPLHCPGVRDHCRQIPKPHLLCHGQPSSVTAKPFAFFHRPALPGDDDAPIPSVPVTPSLNPPIRGRRPFSAVNSQCDTASMNLCRVEAQGGSMKVCGDFSAKIWEKLGVYGYRDRAGLAPGAPQLH